MDNISLLAKADMLVEQKKYEQALACCYEVLANSPNDCGAIAGVAFIAMHHSMFDKAISLLQDIPADQHNNHRIYRIVASCLLYKGERWAAVKYLRGLLGYHPRDDAIRALLPHVMFEGPDYYDVISQIHGLMKPDYYIEIGVSTGASLKLVSDQCRAIAIDPFPELTFIPPTTHKIFTLTSDAFFADTQMEKDLGSPTYQLAFVDGLHEFTQALRDIVNLSNYAGEGSITLVHDCFPLDCVSALADRTTNIWSGDVWKVIPALKQMAPEMEVHVIGTRPTGLGIIKNLQHYAKQLEAGYGQAVDSFDELDLNWLKDDQDKILNLMANDQEKIASFISI